MTVTVCLNYGTVCYLLSLKPPSSHFPRVLSFVVCVGGDQKRVSDSPELTLQAAVNHLTWVLGTKLLSFEAAERALNQWAVSPLPAW